ncbi:MAG: hypothetical protein Q4E41_08165 [Bacteroidales bacterium]|nr:hypothetical protein [Bacteroidales bacterium]
MTKSSDAKIVISHGGGNAKKGSFKKSQQVNGAMRLMAGCRDSKLRVLFGISAPTNAFFL